MQTNMSRRIKTVSRASLLALGALLALSVATSAADMPIIIGKPIIHKGSKPRPKKYQSRAITASVASAKQRLRAKQPGEGSGT